jgi:hypothetical protein
LLAASGISANTGSMTRMLLIGGLATLGTVCGLKAEDAKVPPKTLPADTRKESIANLESHISQREQRLTEWGKDIIELDARIEKRVEELVKMLGSMSDPDPAGGKVTRLKQDAIEGLKRGMDAYAGKRRQVADAISSGDTAAQRDLDKFDERINKRVDQIAELAKSVPAQPAAGDYEYDGASYWNGYFFENIRLHEEANQVRRGATAKSLKQGIDRLDKRRDSLKVLLSKRIATQAERKLYTRELGKLDAYADHLKVQLRDVTLSSVEGGKPIGMDQPHDISQLLDDARRDLRDDVSRLFRTYDEFAKGRIYVSQLKADLAARQESLSKKPPAVKAAE